MKKKLLFIFALLCMVAQGAWAQRVVNLSELAENTEITVQDGDVLTGELSCGLVYIPDGATVTLNGINLNIPYYYVPDDSRVQSTIQCLGDATIILEEGSENKIEAWKSSGIHVQKKGKTLTIKGSGSLDVRGGYEYAGIGGCTDSNIVIEDGIINARSPQKTKYSMFFIVIEFIFCIA